MKNKQILTGEDLEKLIYKEIEWGKKYFKDLKAVNRLTGNRIKRKIWLGLYWLRESILSKIPSISFVWIVMTFWCYTQRNIDDFFVYGFAGGFVFYLINVIMICPDKRQLREVTA